VYTYPHTCSHPSSLFHGNLSAAYPLDQRRLLVDDGNSCQNLNPINFFNFDTNSTVCSGLVMGSLVAFSYNSGTSWPPAVSHWCSQPCCLSIWPEASPGLVLCSPLGVAAGRPIKGGLEVPTWSRDK
jgi:hypothetical protein